MKTATSEKRSPRATSKPRYNRQQKAAVAKPEIVPLSPLPDGPVQFRMKDGRQYIHCRECYLYPGLPRQVIHPWSNDIQALCRMPSVEALCYYPKPKAMEYVVVLADLVDIDAGIDAYHMHEVCSLFSGGDRKGFFFRNSDGDRWLPGRLSGIDEHSDTPFRSGSKWFAQCGGGYCSVEPRQQIGN